MGDKQQEKLNATLKQLEQGVADVYTSDNYIRFLRVMGKFHDYSVNNQILIASQMPEATYVAGYQSWMSNFKRHVRQGEKAITILAPQKRMVEVETDREDEFGNAVTEKREYISFRPVSVFDVSQTEGEPLPHLTTRLMGDVRHFPEVMEAVRAAAPCLIRIEPIDNGDAAGYYSRADRQIVVREGMSEIQTIKTAIHETAHARLHSENRSDVSRNREEVEAESVAYVVCSHYGIDTSDYSFSYVAGWAGGQETGILKKSLETIHDAAKSIIADIDKALENRTLLAPDLKADPITKDSACEKAEKLVKDMIADVFGRQQGEVTARVYGTEVLADEPIHVKVMVDYAADVREDELFDAVRAAQKTDEVLLDICPVSSVQTVGTPVRAMERTDDSWPMITVTYSSYDGIPLGKMNVMEAKRAFAEAEENARQGSFARVNVSYTYEGKMQERTSVVRMGEGRKNFLEYLDVPAPVITYLNRHVQLLDVMHRTRYEEIAPGTQAQADYEDMIFEWAENQRLELNYNPNPELAKPPEFDPLIKLHDRWEMVR